MTAKTIAETPNTDARRLKMTLANVLLDITCNLATVSLKNMVA